MKAGETSRFDCEECSCEFEVTLEPKVRDNPKTSTEGMKPNEVMCCPFCGGEICDDQNSENCTEEDS